MSGAFATPGFVKWIPSFSSSRGLPVRKHKRRTRTSFKMTLRPQVPLSYSSSGVDIERETDSVKALVQSLGKVSSRPKGSYGALVDHEGGFSGLIEFGDRLLAMCTDGVGSKLILAEQMNYFETVALDCMAMNVNDLICVGAEPLAFVDYIASPKPAKETWAAIGRSLALACTLARVSLCGGETATLPDVVKGLDLSGTALGWVPKGMEIDGNRVNPEDKIIGLPSSGIHSNGYTLVRKIVDRSNLDLKDPLPFEISPERVESDIWRHKDLERGPVTLGEILLNPTRIYVDPIVDLLIASREGCGPCDYADIHAIAHITGGGLSNLLRLKSGVGYHISDALEIPEEFKWLQNIGEVSNFEMYRTFNMGMGMCVVVAKNASEQVAQWLADRLKGTKIVGEVTASGKVTHLNGVEFESY